MYSTNYISDFYDNIKANQQELINNHNTSCQKGGYSILDSFHTVQAENIWLQKGGIYVWSNLYECP